MHRLAAPCARLALAATTLAMSCGGGAPEHGDAGRMAGAGAAGGASTGEPGAAGTTTGGNGGAAGALPGGSAGTTAGASSGGGAGSGGTSSAGGAGGGHGGAGAPGAADAGTPADPQLGDAYLYAVGSGGAAKSYDGKTWMAFPDGQMLEVTGACVGDGITLLMNHNGHPGAGQPKAGVWASTNQIDFVRIWRLPAPVDTGGDLPGEDCAFRQGLFTTAASYSTDGGETWTPTIPRLGNRAVVAGNGVIVACGNDSLGWSVDGISWTRATYPGSDALPADPTLRPDFNRVAFASGKFLVSFGFVTAATRSSYESVDGKTWVPTKDPLPDQKVGDYDGMVDGAAGKLYVHTPRAVYWLPADAPPGTAPWTKLEQRIDGPIGGTESYAVTPSYYSTDGVTWAPATKKVGFTIKKIFVLKEP